MKSVVAVVIVGGCFAAGAFAQSIELDNFNSGTATGSAKAGTSWVGNVVQNATTITVGGTAKDDNGWGKSGAAINATGMNYIAIIAQRNPENAAPSLVIEFDDRNLHSQIFSVATSLFAVGSLTQVQIPIASWGSVDPTHITGWSIGGGTPPPGLLAFAMTFDDLALTVGSVASNGAPVITTQPLSQTLSTDISATLSVAATGTGTLSYQWRKDGANIVGATNAVLTLPLLQATDAGSYSVVVSNSIGSVTSGAAILTVLIPPTITIQPTSQSAVQGSNVTFTISVTGTTPISYQWRKSGVVISGATGAMLTLPNVQPSDAGSYSVDVSNAALTSPVSSNSAVLTVTVPTGGGGTSGGGGSAGGTPSGGSSGGGGGGSSAGGGTTGGGGTTTSGGGTTTGGATNSGGSNPAVSPTISAQPASQSAIAGGTASFTVTASGSPTPSYQWQKNGVAITGATNATLNLSNLQLPDAGSYTVVVQNSAGSLTSNVATLTVSPPSFAGTYFGAVGSSQGTWALYVRRDNTAVFIAYLVQSQSGIVQNLTINSDGSFTVASASAAGRTATAMIVPAAGAPPHAAAASTTISGQITSTGQVTGMLGGLGINFSGAADTSSGPSPVPIGLYTAPNIGTSAGTIYTIVGASGRAVVVTTSATSADEATGTVDATGRLSASTAGGAQLNLAVNSATASVSGTFVTTGGNTTSFAGLADGVVATTRLVNLSVLSSAGSGDQALTAGFVIAGSGTKQVLIRGIGPALSQFGVTNFLPNPVLKLFNGEGRLVQSNAAWGGSSMLSQMFTQVGAFDLPPAASDCALLATLAVGQNTAQVASITNLSGTALVETYDADQSSPSARFVNMSARSQVGGGAGPLTIGFVISGNGPATLLIRGIGPALTLFGLTDVLVDPQLTVFDVAQKSIAQNNDWGGGAALTSAFTGTGAFALPANSKDAALLLTLQPGQYTAQVSPVGNITGVALVEIYVVP